MAVLLKFKTKGVTPRERLLNYIDISRKWLEKIRFISKRYEIWKNHYMEELGGEKLGEYESFNDVKNRIAKRDSPELDSWIILFEGEIRPTEKVVLKSPDGRESLVESLPAKYYLFNRRLRKSVGSTALFYTFIINDWKLYLENPSLRELFKNSIEPEIEFVTIGKNQFASVDVRERVFCFYQKRKNFLIDLFRTIKEEMDEREGLIADIIRPYNIEFMANTLDSFDKDLNAKLGQFFKNNIEYKFGSILLEAKNEDSFEKFYLDFRKNFIESLKTELPDSRRFREILYGWLKLEKKLF